jgi:hypothetical protein
MDLRQRRSLSPALISAFRLILEQALNGSPYPLAGAEGTCADHFADRGVMQA